jgi:hypothetical protein
MHIRGMKSLDEVARQSPLALESTAAGTFGQEVGDRLVGALVVDVAKHVVDREEVVGLSRLPLEQCAELPSNIEGGQAGSREQFAGDGRPAMDELRAKLDGKGDARVFDRQDASAESIARFEHEHRSTSGAKLACSF